MMYYSLKKKSCWPWLVFFKKVPTTNDKTLTRYRFDGCILVCLMAYHQTKLEISSSMLWRDMNHRQPSSAAEAKLWKLLSLPAVLAYSCLRCPSRCSRIASWMLGCTYSKHLLTETLIQSGYAASNRQNLLVPGPSRDDGLSQVSRAPPGTPRDNCPGTPCGTVLGTCFESRAPANTPFCSKTAPALDHEDLALNHEGLALNHEGLALNHEDLALNHEDLALNHEVLALNHEDLALNHEDLALNHEDLALNHEVLALNHEGPSWFKAKSSWFKAKSSWFKAKSSWF